MVELQKWYTRSIGIFFTLIVFSLLVDVWRVGYRLETWHKLFHIVLGIVVLRFGWDNKRFWRPFSIVNGIFFLIVGLFGWIFPDFLGLDAFNRVDTLLHSIVGGLGLGVGLFWRK